jgi:hypothetical protein
MNQDDILERNQQLLLMPTIYANAQRTVVWLGREDLQDRITLQALHFCESILQLQISNRAHEVNTIQQHLFGNRIYQDFPQSFQLLVDSPWFRRVWIIQEFCLSPIVIFMCGNAEFSQQALHLLHDTILETELNDYLRTNYTLLHAMVPLGDILDAKKVRAEQGPVSFADALRESSVTYRASDPRDRVFALYGLCHPEHTPPGPDYSLSIADVFRMATEYCILHDTSIEHTLALTITHPPRSNSPSWVPNLADDARTITSYVQDHFAAGNKAQTIGTARVDAQVLTLSAACIVDSIQEVYKLDYAGVLALSRTRQEETRTVVMEQKRYPTGERLSEIYWRLLIADQCRVGPGDTGKHAAEAYGDLYLDPRVEGFNFEEGINSDEPLGKAQAAYIEAMVLQELMFLCRTKKGLLGWVLPEVTVGDQVCIFKGFCAPWILRPIANGLYQLKGSAYVHGIMDGETLSWKDFEWGVIRIE